VLLQKPTGEPDTKKKTGEPVVVLPIVPVINFTVNAPKTSLKKEPLKKLSHCVIMYSSI
jgi:hypothetical protein